MEKPNSFIKNTFLQLTSKTYPHGYEDDLVNEFTQSGILPNLSKDEWGNYYFKVGESRTMFTSHFDTASSHQVTVNHIIDKQQIISTSGTILGADDKAGTTIMLWMIKNNIPGLYYFFIGEECGCIGSSAASTYGKFKGNYDRVISFDRRGTNSVITFQSSTRCCSDEFANELAKQLNQEPHFFYKSDKGGVYTDSAEFVELIPECTNISVGYQNEHTIRETQDLYHLIKLANAVIRVDWENLPTKRNPAKKESRWESFYNEWYNPSLKTESKIIAKVESDDEDGFDDFSYGWAGSGIVGSSDSKKRRKRKKTGRKFYDNGGDLTPIESNGKYDVYQEKFLCTELTDKEREHLKELEFVKFQLDCGFDQ